jgi:hypothetical protein
VALRRTLPRCHGRLKLTRLRQLKTDPPDGLRFLRLTFPPFLFSIFLYVAGLGSGEGENSVWV